MLERFHIPDDQAIESGLVASSIEGAQSKIEGFNFDARKHLLEYDDVLNKHREIIYKKRREVLEKSSEDLREYVRNVILSHGYTALNYEKREQEIGGENMRQLGKAAFLRAIDSLWVEHLESMEYLRESVRLRAYGQQDPLVEYKNEGHQMFQRLLTGIDALAADFVMRASVTTNPVQGHITAGPKVGRNDPCPCNSGKKYKKCHGV
ncbi:MAG: preprotein translocase subunit SecA [Parcubacteria group bacterium Greene1014_47]|nr:MAG: preprotein translocase subunit SecA [Parcubacteria group bacterium Greene1014_47]